MKFFISLADSLKHIPDANSIAALLELSKGPCNSLIETVTKNSIAEFEKQKQLTGEVAASSTLASNAAALPHSIAQSNRLVLNWLQVDFGLILLIKTIIRTINCLLSQLLKYIFNKFRH